MVHRNIIRHSLVIQFGKLVSAVLVLHYSHLSVVLPCYPSQNKHVMWNVRFQVFKSTCIEVVVF